MTNLEDVKFTVSLGWIPICASILVATMAVLHALRKMFEPVRRLTRQHDYLLTDYSIRTECDDVPIDKKSGLRDPNEFYRKHPFSKGKGDRNG